MDSSPPAATCAAPPKADMDAMSLFALEVGDMLSSRSLECAYASALSVVSYDGMAPGHQRDQRTARRSSGLNEESSWQLRSQLMNMYLRVGAGGGQEHGHGHGRGHELCLAPQVAPLAVVGRRCQYRQ